MVVGYRPYYEWVPSRYSQSHKRTPQQRRKRRRKTEKVRLAGKD